MQRHRPTRPTRAADPFTRPVLARPALLRVLVAGAALVPLWLAIAWAVSVP